MPNGVDNIRIKIVRQYTAEIKVEKLSIVGVAEKLHLFPNDTGKGLQGFRQQNGHLISQ